MQLQMGRRKMQGGRGKERKGMEREKGRRSSTGKGAKPLDAVFSDSELGLTWIELFRLLWSTAHGLDLIGKGRLQCNLPSYSSEQAAG